MTILRPKPASVLLADPRTAWILNNSLRLLATFPKDRRDSLYICQSCGCMFRPETVDGVVFPDRHSSIGEDRVPLCESVWLDGVLVDCSCHEIPYQIGDEDAPVAEPKLERLRALVRDDSETDLGVGEDVDEQPATTTGAALSERRSW